MKHILIAAITIFLPFSALAQGVVQCGIPKDVNLKTDPGFEFCDIYQRQLAFKEPRDDLSRQLQERRANFLAPRQQAYDQYKKDLEALHNSIEE